MKSYRVDLQSDDRNKRKKALDDIKCIMLKEKYEDIEELEQVFKEVLNLFSDRSETCRECAVKLTKELIGLPIVTESDYYAAALITAIYKRLGEKEMERSEEVRLELISLLHLFVSKFTNMIPAYVNQIIMILSKTLCDTYPVIRRESCECASLLAHSAPKFFFLESKSLIKPLIENFVHQHYRIRLAAIQALGDVMHGDSTSMEIVIGPLGERLSDQVIMVRKAVVEVVGTWLLYHEDRYSYFHYLISLILTSMCDDAPEIQEVAMKYWHQAGEHYLKENEDDLKDKIDFLTEVPKHYPQNIQRPNLGCRILVQRHMTKILLCVDTELEEWQVETRVKAASLCRITLLNAESNMTHHLQKILRTLVHGCKDEDSRVVEHLEKAAEYVGYFVPPDVYLKPLLPELEGNSTTAHLRVLAGILRGSKCDSLSEKLIEVMDVLKQHHICWNKDLQYQSHLLNCCSVVMDVCKDKSAVVSQELFSILIAVLSLTADDYIMRKSKVLLDKLQEINKFDTPESMFSTYSEAVLYDIAVSVDVWTVHSPERYILGTIFEGSGQNLNFNIHIILPLLIIVAKPEKDPQLKLKIFTMLSSFIVEYGISAPSEQSLKDFVLSLIQDVILPNLVWKAGCSAEAIRTASVTCLYTLLRNPPVLSESAVKTIADNSLPLLLSVVEDSSKSTRSLACCTLSNLVCLLRKSKLLTPDHMHRILAVVIKRLDDVSDEVRLECLSTIRSLFHELPADYDKECSKAILESMFNSLFLHLDDPVPSFQHVMIDTIKDVCHVYPSLTWNKLNEMKGSYRSTVDFDQLLEYLKNLNISTSD